MKRADDPRVPRTWRVPPAILRGPGETIDRIGVLEEHEPETALLLWRTARDVELWAITDPEARGDLFTPNAADQRRERLRNARLAPEVHGAVRNLARLLADAEGAEGAAVSTNCMVVARWARAGGLTESALAFAQAASLADPHDGAAALVTGMCATAAGQPDRAHTWLLRAVAVSRRGRQAAVYAGAYLALGHHHAHCGATAAARRAYLRAVRAARRWGLPAERAGAAYGLFRLALADGDTAAAADHAKTATVASSHLPHDLIPFGPEMAAFWLTVRKPARALRTLARLEPALRSADERLAAAVVRLRAGVELHDDALARRTWSQAWRIVQEDGPGEEGAVRALVSMARAAGRLRDPALLARAGRAALARVPADDFSRVQQELATLGMKAEVQLGERAA